MMLLSLIKAVELLVATCNKRISLQLSEVHEDKRWQQRDQNRWPWQEDIQVLIYKPIGVKSNIIQLQYSDEAARPSSDPAAGRWSWSGWHRNKYVSKYLGY